ncbi:hypothetical protein RBEAN4_0229 [Rickettsia bellii str. RML An4]|uniref:Uncharacterized protein n=1 Tax=Rickettsia bellii str. RML An4 TaxID=1359193 RepID=A0A0F3Q9N4_RICBE|nr:hypothetical protein RBEAN4_0229 [Rickettsia bellii str. RML An4]
MSSRGLTTGSRKATFNTNNFSILSWIPWTSHGMTGETDPHNKAYAGMTPKALFDLYKQTLKQG